MPVPPYLSLEDLLADDGSLRRLARSLVTDPGQADDLVQEAWLVRLGSKRAPSPAWMNAVVRNLWRDLLRSGERRTRRESAAARSEATVPADEVVAELELRRRVAEAVLALDEPFRSALFLRFYRDQPLAVIARERGVSVSTVHEWIQGGLGRVRADLDRAHGGHRRAWSLVLCSAARGSGGFGPGTVGGIVMGSGMKVVLALLLVAVLAWWWRGGVAGRDPRLAATAPEAHPSAGEARADETSTPERAGRRAADAGPEPALPGPSPVSGKVVDGSGAPIAGVAVRAEDWMGAGLAPGALAGDDGSFSLELPAEVQRLACADARFSTLVSGTADGHWIVVVAPRRSFAGLLLDPEGHPVRSAQLSLHLDLKRSLIEAGVARGEVHPARCEFESDSAGRFALEDAGGGRCLEVRARGFAPTVIDLPTESASDLVVTLARDPRSVVVTGVVLDSGGEPVERAWVSAGLALERTQSDGSFELRWPGGLEPFRAELARTLAENGLERASLIAVAPGRLPACRPLDELDLAAPVELRLGAEPKRIRGRVLDVEGRPVGDCLVWFEDPYHFGYEELFSGAQAGEVELKCRLKFSPELVEQAVRGGLGSGTVRTALDGSFELDGLMARAYWLEAGDPRTGQEAGPVRVEAGQSDVELVLGAGAGSTRIAGRVFSEAGEPIAGVELTTYLGTSGPDWFTGPHAVVARTGPDGSFEFRRSAARATWLLLEHPRLFWPWFSLAEVADLENVEIAVPVLCELQVDLFRSGIPDLDRKPHRAVWLGTGHEIVISSGSAFETTVEFLAADGAHVDSYFSPSNAEENARLDPGNPVHERMLERGQQHDETGMSWSGNARLCVGLGPSPVVWVSEAARTLVVHQAGVELARFAIRLDSRGRTLVRP